MKAANDELIERLYNSYYMEVYSYIMTMVGNEYDAQELTQETFYKAMRSEYKGGAKEKTWLCAIAKNLCIDMFRKNKRINKDTPIEEMELEDTHTVEKQVVDRCYSIEIHKALHKLEEPYKEVFSLSVFGELSFKEIGEVFGKSENWARVTFYRGKVKLKALV